MTLSLSSEYVGRESRPLRLTVTARQIMNYAFAVDDSNPRYLDDTRPRGIVAPPMLATALTWKISANFAHYWDSAGFPAEVLARQVHYSEQIHWYRCMVPGDELEITGTVQAIVPHRAGTHLVMRYTARDAAGETVFVESIGGLLRGVRCQDEGRGDPGTFPEAASSPDLAPSWERALYIDPWAPYRYDAGADIYFPIHTSPSFARSVSLPGIIYQGAATLSLALRDIVNREADGDPGRLRTAACLFTAMVRPASLVTLRVYPENPETSDGSIGFVVLNQQRKEAIRCGRVTLSPA
ncbi:MAG: MaoC family dehydratase N-terminal domain-containing protein [Candidatus Hydrogenedentes bacterium]|nr:MaoC family dehydratase N-terminal domain-containing protein [Candidatus Hydrogenedentota bacterium]